MEKTFAASLTAQYGTIEILGVEYDAARVLRAIAPAKYKRMQEEFVAEQMARYRDDEDTKSCRPIDLLEDLG